MSDLLPAVLHSLGVPGETDVLGLPIARRVCVLLVDGLGDALLAAAADAAPTLRALASPGRTLRSGFPSTTATSVASLWTGLPPGAHGMAGLTLAIPGTDTLLNLLRWQKEVDPLEWQPAPTVFERAAADGVEVSAVVPRAFDGSGLTRAALRGAPVRSAQSAGEIVAGAASALRRGDRSLVYAYYGELDATGHRSGCSSEAWLLQLEHLDHLVAQLVERLPPDARLYVTADHGMIDLDLDECVDADHTPALMAGVRVLGGEIRARHVYTRPGAGGDVRAAWASTLGPRAHVRSRDDAVAAGWFGPGVRPEVLERIGDVVVAATGRGGVLASVGEPHQTALVGQHGSLTDEEQVVPLLTVVGAGA